MVKFLRIAFHEYTRHVLRRRFIFALLGMPAVIAITGLGIYALIRLEIDDTPIGYVDQSGFLADPVAPPQLGRFEIQVPIYDFINETDARNALEAGEIQAYYTLAGDFMVTGLVDLHYLEREPSESAQEQFESFILANHLVDQSPEIVDRIAEGSDLTVRSVDGSREFSEKDIVALLMPFFNSVLFLIVIFTSSGYLMQAVVEEKENRTIEILVTSVSSNQLIAGKVIGNISVGLTQLIVWIGFTLGALEIGRKYFDFLIDLTLSAETILLTVLTLLPSFIMVAALMTAIGATVTDEREGQQMTGIISMPIWIPYILTWPIMANPNGPLAVALSFFPLTAPITLSLRVAFAIIPTWQIALNVFVLFLAAAVAIWFAGRVFRIGMLRYGKRVNWREMFGLTR